MSRTILCAFVSWLAIALAAPAQEPGVPAAGVEALPPWQRVLVGEDAKRAEELSQRITEREDSDDYPGAVEAGFGAFGLVSGRSFTRHTRSWPSIWVDYAPFVLFA